MFRIPSTDPTTPAEPVPIAVLVAEGFGPWDSPYTKGPRDVIEALSPGSSTALCSSTTSAVAA